MRYSRERKAETRRKILDSAHRLFTAKGFEATSIDEIMRDCALTRGGFYMHFRSKRELYREALKARPMMTERAPAASARRSAQVEALLDDWLASDQNGEAAFFATDVASDIPEVRAAYTRAVKAMLDRVRRASPSEVRPDDPEVGSTAALLVGAIVIARTTDDPELKRMLIGSCREGAQQLLERRLREEPLTFFWSPVGSHSEAQS